MNRLKMIVVFFGILLVSIYVALFLSPPVLWALVEPGDPIGEPVFVLMNPLRDKNPETKAEELLKMLRDRKCVELIGTFESNIVCTSEFDYQIRDWVLSNRVDREGLIKLYFRVTRVGTATDLETSTGNFWFELENKGGEWIVVNATTYY